MSRSQRRVARYVLVASLVRGADGGAAVGLITLAGSVTGRPGGGAGNGRSACCPADGTSQLLGPLWPAPSTSARRDDRRPLPPSWRRSPASGLSLAGAAVTLGRTPVLLPAALIGLAGLCGPLLTGGLSAKLAQLTTSDDEAQRRAEGWDATTYGIGSPWARRPWPASPLS